MITNNTEYKQSPIISRKIRYNKSEALKSPKIETQKGRRTKMDNHLASDFADFPAKAFQEHLAARLWEEDHAAER